MKDQREIEQFPILDPNVVSFWGAANQFFGLLDNTFWAFVNQKTPDQASPIKTEIQEIGTWLRSALEGRQVEGLLLLRTLLKKLGRSLVIKLILLRIGFLDILLVHHS